MIASQLRPGARAWSADGFDSSWSAIEYWMANIFDAIQENTWVAANYGVKERDRGKPPERFPRPADLRNQKTQQGKIEANARRFQRALRRRRERLDGDRGRGGIRIDPPVSEGILGIPEEPDR